MDGAGGGTRTHTVSLPTDFESVTSTIPSHRHLYRVLHHTTKAGARQNLHSPGSALKTRASASRPTPEQHELCLLTLLIISDTGEKFKYHRPSFSLFLWGTAIPLDRRINGQAFKSVPKGSTHFPQFTRETLPPAFPCRVHCPVCLAGLPGGICLPAVAHCRTVCYTGTGSETAGLRSAVSHF